MYHKELTILNNSSYILQEDISDGIASNTNHHVVIRIDPADMNNHDILIKSTSGTHPHVKEVTVTLQYEDSSHNGLVQYSYEVDNNNKEARFVVEALPNAIYHLIKGFFIPTNIITFRGILLWKPILAPPR